MLCVGFPRFHESCRAYTRGGQFAHPLCMFGRFDPAEFAEANSKEPNAVRWVPQVPRILSGVQKGVGILAYPFLYVPGFTCPVCAIVRSKLISCPKSPFDRAAWFRILPSVLPDASFLPSSHRSKARCFSKRNSDERAAFALT